MKEFIVLLAIMFLSGASGALLHHNLTAAKETKATPKPDYYIDMSKGYIKMYNQRDRLIWSGQFDENYPSLEEAILKDNL